MFVAFSLLYRLSNRHGVAPAEAHPGRAAAQLASWGKQSATTEQASITNYLHLGA